MSGKGLLHIPAAVGRRRSDATLATPWFGVDRGEPDTGGRPWLGTFRSERFVDEFLDGVKSSADGWTPQAWEQLLAYRDFAEPPQAMLDADGHPRYPAAPDGAPGEDGVAIGRLPLLAEQLEEGDLIGRSIPADDPAWLRKLYRPVHRHFHLVACELVCHQPYLPPIERERIVETGMVVRRLAPEPDRVVWQDWVHDGDRKGVWARVADHRMRRLDAPQVAVDPADVQGLSFGEQVDLRARLGLDAHAKLSLASTDMSLMAEDHTHDGDRAHRVAYGYLPVSSAEQQAPRMLQNESDSDEVEQPGASVANAKKWFLDGIQDRLERELEGQAAKFQRVFWDNLEVLRKWLFPNRLTSGQLEQAWADALGGGALDWKDTDLDAAQKIRLVTDELESVVTAAFEQIWKVCARPHTPPSSDPSWWPIVCEEALEESGVLTGGVLQIWVAPQSWPWPYRIDIQPELLCPLLLEAVYDHLESAWPPLQASSVPLTGDDAQIRDVFVSFLLLSTRYHRLQLMDRLHEEIQVAWPPGRDLFKLEEEIRPDPRLTVGACSDELDAWIWSERMRPEVPRPWPELGFLRDEAASSPHRAVHGACRKIEAELARFETVMRAAGPAYAETVEQHAQQKIRQLTDPAAGPELEKDSHGELFGLDLNAQPERGLLVFPTTDITDEMLDPDTNYPPGSVLRGVLDHYRDIDEQAPPERKEKLRKQADESSGHGARVRKRYDSDSLYAVWCFARVAGRRDCEPHKIVWSRRTDVFQIAEHDDVLGAQPVAFELPNLPKLMRDLRRIPRARARPFASANTPHSSGVSHGGDPSEVWLRRSFGVACTYGIPVLTICAWIAFGVIYRILIVIPGFFWMVLMKFCMPSTSQEKS